MKRNTGNLSRSVSPASRIAYKSTVNYRELVMRDYTHGRILVHQSLGFGLPYYSESNQEEMYYLRHNVRSASSDNLFDITHKAFFHPHSFDHIKCVDDLRHAPKDYSECSNEQYAQVFFDLQDLSGSTSSQAKIENFLFMRNVTSSPYVNGIGLSYKYQTKLEGLPTGPVRYLASSGSYFSLLGPNDFVLLHRYTPAQRDIVVSEQHREINELGIYSTTISYDQYVHHWLKVSQKQFFSSRSTTDDQPVSTSSSKTSNNLLAKQEQKTFSNIIAERATLSPEKFKLHSNGQFARAGNGGLAAVRSISQKNLEVGAKVAPSLQKYLPVSSQSGKEPFVISKKDVYPQNGSLGSVLKS